MGLLWLIKQSNPSAYEVTQICYYFEYLTILALAKQPWWFYHSNYCKYQNVFVLKKICLGLIWSIIGVTFLATCTLGLIWLRLGFTLIRFLVWYNQCKTVWNTCLKSWENGLTCLFKVQSLDCLVIFLQLYAVKTYTKNYPENILPKIANIFSASSMI